MDIYFIGIIIGIIYFLSIPFLGRWIAIQKDQNSFAWFWLCLFFGVFALITICAAPNLHVERAIKEINSNINKNVPND